MAESSVPPQDEASRARRRTRWASASAAPVSVSVRGDDPGAAQLLLDGLRPAEPALVLLFGSPRGVLAPVARRLAGDMPNARVVGCSSAGEIGDQGYQRGSIVAVAFPASSFRAEAVALRDQSRIPVSRWLSKLRLLRDKLPKRRGRSLFGILLADGLARHEDVLVAALDAALPGVPVVGGSAGDGLDFIESVQILDGQAVPGAAIFVLVETTLDVSDVSFAHFTPTERRAVVTRADPAAREILELNAAPAAAEYARLTGLDASMMERADFARHPLLLRTGGKHHVRAISGVGPGGSLRLMSSIEPGMVLTIGQAGDVTQGFAGALDGLPKPPLMVLGFDCILRRLAVEQAGMTERMAELFARYAVAGFNTYGEQHSGMHVNQTFVGLALMPGGSKT